MNMYTQELEALRREARDSARIDELEELLLEARKLIYERAVYYNADEAKGDGAGLVKRIDALLSKKRQ